MLRYIRLAEHINGAERLLTEAGNPSNVTKRAVYLVVEKLERQKRVTLATALNSPTGGLSTQDSFLIDAIRGALRPKLEGSTAICSVGMMILHCDCRTNAGNGKWIFTRLQFL